MWAILLAVRFTLAVVFAVAGLAKLNDTRGSRKSLGDFGLPASLTPAVAVLLPLTELVCVIALLHERWAVPGAVGVMTLLALFSAGITVSLLRGRAPSCHCFGQLSSAQVSWRTLVRNLMLLTLAGAVAWKADQIPYAGPVLSRKLFETAILVGVGAMAVMLGLTLWFLFHMLQQNGRLMLRVEAIETKLNIDPNAGSVKGMPLGDPAPPFELRALEGGTASLKALGETGKPILIVFIEPECGACQALAPELAQWQREYAEQFMIVPVSRGEEELNRAKSAAFTLSNLILQADREVAQAYRVTATPSAVLVAEGKIASRIATGLDAIRTLVTQTALPPLVRKGDAVPSIRLADLTGEILDLGALRGRRTLLLFWDPSCGFCQKMLPDLKAWESPKGAPELVVISSGSLDATRGQGFRVRVLLDHSFGSGRIFGATGTPAAVMLDESGRVASEVGLGAPAVFALAGAGVAASRS